MNPNPQLTQAQRDHFDRELESVLEALPQAVHCLLEEIPLVVEDAPSPRLMRELGASSPEEICGLYHGEALPDRSVMDGVMLPEQVVLYRLGILTLASQVPRAMQPAELREQIRITILHELGHHHGMDEDDLEELGYD